MGKNIVLLSDGTGNSAAKLFKTNVWRLYQALDLTPGSDQIAFYDDGVGTSTFRPLALLGGGLGIGLKRNVKDLYTSLCQNYEKGDRIYAFGFSRGAFTIRVLAGMIATQGVIPGKTMQPEELRQAVDRAWKLDRKDYKTHWRAWRDRETATEVHPTIPPGNHAAPIAFVGVWDTVDAYGLPVDELKRGLDYWLLGLSFPDQDLSPVVERACHALALDDERRTFHPVLWNEAFEKKLLAAKKITRDRLQQVWFMGMHSNVGGGYAKDGLSFVSLNWMVQHAHDAGLNFHKWDLKEFQRRANAHADIGDSRAGLAAYYRYGPRRVNLLCNDDYNKVWIDRPKIHHSALDRIKAQHMVYVPHVIPANYDVVGPNGDLIPNTYETPTQAVKREEDLERAWDLVWWRRVSYFVTLAFTALLLAFPWMPWVKEATGCTGYWCFVEPVLLAASRFLPDMLNPWIDAYRLNIGMFLSLAGLLAGSLGWGIWLERRIRMRASEAWAHLTNHVTPTLDESRPLSWIARKLRSSQWLVGSYRWIVRQAIPFVAFVAVVLAAVLFTNRFAFDVGEAVGVTCPGTSNDFRSIPAAVTVTQPFETKNPCFATGLLLIEGTRYTLTYKVQQPWKDGSEMETTPIGFESADAGWKFAAAVPLRRSWRANWFQPIVHIGRYGRDRYVLRSTHDKPDEYVSEAFMARTSGELFLFVNDAVVVPVPGWSFFYDGMLKGEINNKGSAIVTVAPVPATPVQ